jgi:cysteine desulfurase/selenocysteine lyase
MPKTANTSTSSTIDFDEVKKDFSIFSTHQQDSQQPLHYLDSAASGQKPDCVVNAITDCYRKNYGPVHRGLYPLAENASEQYEVSRQTIASFINSPSRNNIVFTRSATEAINLVASGWAKQQVNPGDEIWVSQMEHHSNFLPWQRVCQERGAHLRVIPIDSFGRLDLANATGLFGKKTRLIAVTHVSNVLGVVNPIEKLVALADNHSIPVLVDAAQSVGHMTLDVQKLDCDFLVASAHKMCGPTGVGFLYAKHDRLVETEPLLLGGGMVDEVSIEGSSWADIPARFEAGSPNLAGVLGFAAAATYLNDIGRVQIEARVKALTRVAGAALANIEGVIVYGPDSDDSRAGIISFNIDGIHPHDVAQIAGERGVAIRAGHHCCQPLMAYLGVSSTARASFSFYNNEDDISALVAAIHKTKNVLGS